MFDENTNPCLSSLPSSAEIGVSRSRKLSGFFIYVRGSLAWSSLQRLGVECTRIQKCIVTTDCRVGVAWYSKKNKYLTSALAANTTFDHRYADALRIEGKNGDLQNA